MVWYSESGVKPNTMVRSDPETETVAASAKAAAEGKKPNP